MRYTPEQIRDIFENHADDELRVVHAIKAALEELGWLRTKVRRENSPFSLAKLTKDLPHQERLLQMALREQQVASLARRFEQGDYVSHRQRSEPVSEEVLAEMTAALVRLYEEIKTDKL